MTFAPPTLQAARRLLLDHLDEHRDSSAYPTDLDPSEVGIVGDAAHVGGGTSYHLGRSDLSSTAYSIRTARDRAGLSEAASAVDVGEFRVTTGSGTYAHRHLAAWVVEQCQAAAPDTRDIREVIWSPDGTRVLRYDRERGYASEPREGESDDSHRWHDHFSLYRDAEFRYSLYNLFHRWLVGIGALDMGDLDTAMATATTHRVEATLRHKDRAKYTVVVNGKKEERDEPNEQKKVLDATLDGVKELLDRPAVVAGPVDVLTFEALVRRVLMEPEVVAVYGAEFARVLAAAQRAGADAISPPA